MEKSLPDQMKEKLHQIFGNDGTEKDGITTYQSDEDGLITQALLKEKEGVVEIRIAYHDEDTDAGIDLPEPAYIFNITSQDIKRIEGREHFTSSYSE